MRPLSIQGAWLVSPAVHRDLRGEFFELYQSTSFTEAAGHPLELKQASVSMSHQDVVRGIHYAVPGQAKYVSCVYGAILDVIVDIRVGSPTFGAYQIVPLDDTAHEALYISGDLGHGFQALTDDATVVYLQSRLYDPKTERALNPMDPDLNITWVSDMQDLSQRDLDAPTLARALEQGLLPIYRESQ